MNPDNNYNMEGPQTVLRYCLVRGCNNNLSTIATWKNQPCQLHEGVLRKDCPCLIPFRLFNFPISLDMRQKWLKAIDRIGYEPDKCTCVCSEHFVDEQPTANNPLPTLKIVTIQKAGKRGRPPTKSREGPPNKVSNTGGTQSGSTVEVLPHKNPKVQELISAITKNPKNVGVVQYAVKKRMTLRSVECQTSNKESAREHYVSRSHATGASKKIHINYKCSSSQTDNPVFSVNYLDESACKFYTGLHSKVFWKLVENLSPTEKLSSSVPVEDQIFLCFMRLKLGLLFEDLSRRFNISSSTVSYIFNAWMTRMAAYFKHLVSFLPRLTIREAMPQMFRGCYPNITCIVDIFEICLQPSVLVREKPPANQVPKGKSDTAKFLTAIAPHGYIMFVSKCYDGNQSNAFIAKDCGLIDHIQPYDEVIVDGSFELQPLLAMKHAIAHSPEYVKGQILLCEQANKKTSQTPARSRHMRLHVEGAISRMKGFHVLKCALPLQKEHRGLNNILTVVAALCNLQLAINNFLEKNDKSKETHNNNNNNNNITINHALANADNHVGNTMGNNNVNPMGVVGVNCASNSLGNASNH